MTQTAVLERTKTMSVQDIHGLIRKSLNEARGDIGRFNLLIAGKTGAGKSSLINAMFEWEIAETGVGKPVTTTTNEYRHPNLPLSILDTRGIETGENREELTGRLIDEITRRRVLPVEDQVHVAWYCVRASDRRLDDGQEAVIREIAEAGVPVILVLTQVATRDGQPDPDAVEFAEALRAMDLRLSPAGHGIVMTAAVDHPWHGPAHGLHDLLALTVEVAPKGAENALIAAQQIDLRRKREAARRIIAEHAMLAGVTAASPIPFSDAIALVPVQVAMVGRITAVWGLDIATGSLVSLIGSALLSAGATVIGREVVGNLLKFVPFVGTVLGNALNATVAVTLTMAIGTAWNTLVERFAEHPESLSAMSSAQIRQAFIDEMRAQR